MTTFLSLKRCAWVALCGLFALSCQHANLPSGDAATAAADSADVPPEITAPPGFVVEHLVSPTSVDSSSWVALTFDDRGRLLASDQYGSLYRVEIPAIGEDPAGTKVTPLSLEIGHAQGLLWAHGSLYVVVNSEQGVGGHGSGLYRVTDGDGDGELDTIRLLRAFVGWGEHGPHSVVLGPDGRSLYVMGGNHTTPPEPFASRVTRGWQEDGLFPPILDPRGHAVEIEAPGGWVVRTDTAGTDWELVSVGFRNAFDLAFNEAGDLFTFDSDMEWDLGMPWYRPVRVLHITSGSEFGWRTGSGKWPAYYPDNLPSVVDVGQGSPTGVLMGTRLAFPERYRNGLYIFDWSFGTIYRVDLEPQGASYTGTFEEFLSGVPLPLTDGVAGPEGALYFAAGGRRLNSHLYRVYYAGDEPVEAGTAPALTPPERALRLQLEAFHGRQDPAAVETAWPHLNHPDRFVRYAARVALEHEPVEAWAERVWAEADPVRRLYGVIALARTADASMQEQALEALAGIDYAALAPERRLDLLRAYGLVFMRLGAPSEAWKARVAERLASHFPADNDPENRELAQLLAYVEAPGVIETTLQLLERYAGDAGTPVLAEAVTARSEDYGPTIARMRENMPQPQEIAYARSLSFVRDGWTLEQRRRYFQWFYEALGRSGGESYKGFLEAIRSDALERVPAEAQEALAELTGALPGGRGVDLASLPQPEGPGRSWSWPDVREALNDGLDHPRDFERGRRMYAAALCEACHAVRGEGGSVGPDLTQIGTRFSREDVIEAIILPSAEISDQYAATLVTLTDGSSLVGRVIRVNEHELVLNQNPYAPDQVVTVPRAEIASQQPSPLSLMPPRLIDRLNEQEVVDLMAFLLSGGDPEHEYFKPKTEGEGR